MTPVNVLYDLSALAPVVRHPDSYTGVQRVVHKVAQGLAADSRVKLSFYANGEFAETKRFARIDPVFRECVFVHSMSQRFAERAALKLSPGGRAREALDVVTRKVPLLSKFLVRGLPRLTSYGSKLKRKQLRRFDIYHSPVFPFPEAVQRNPSLRRFRTIYDLTPIKFPQYSIPSLVEAFDAIVREATRKDFFLCISERTKKDWCEHTGIDERRCFVTPLATSEHFKPCNDPGRIAAIRKRCGVPDGQQYFLGLSRIEPRKNIAGVIGAFFELLRQTNRSDLNLILVGGEGWKAEPIFAAAKADAELRSRVIFTGYLPEEDLAPLYTGARAFIYMSFYEGFGLPPLEAMQCGVPVICSNTSSLPEVVGDAGILLPPDDRDGLCAALLDLADDDSKCALMSERSRAQANRFSWSQCVDATVNAYQSAAGS